MNQTKNSRAQLEAELARLRAENTDLRARLAEAPASARPPAEALAPGPAPLEQLVQGMYAAVVFVNVAAQVIWANDAFAELCGVDAGQLLGQPVARFIRPHLTDAATLRYIEESIAAQVAFQYELPKPPHHKVPGWIRVKVLPIRDAGGAVLMMAGLVEDITEWKESQRSLARGEVRFQALAENAPGVLYEWRKNQDGSFEFIYVSPKLDELFGIGVADIVRMPDFVHPDDRTGFIQSMADAVGAVAPWNHEFRVVVDGQPLRWMQGNAVVVGHDERGVVYSGILQDTTPLKHAQAALRERELRLQLAVGGFGDGSWELNLQTQQLTLSSEYKAMLGYQDHEFADAYENWLDHIHPDDLAKLQDIMRQWYVPESEARPVASEYRLRCQDGNYKWVLSRAMVTARDAAGQPLMLSGLHIDISTLKHTQEALDVSMRRLSTVIANFQEGLVLEDADRRIVLVNEAFCNLLVNPVVPAQLVGKAGGWLAEGSRAYVKHPHRYVARITALLQRRKPVSGDLVPLLDGRVLQRDFTPIFDQDRYIGQLWKFQDVTARNQAETDLRRREEKYRGIIENMSLGLVEVDTDDQLLYANQSFCDMTGYCTDELAGQRFSPFLIDGEQLEMVQQKLQTRLQGVSDSYEVVMITKSGERKWLLVSGAPLYGDFHRPIGSIGIYLDVTPQKQLEASLREAKAQAEISTRAKQDFLANMSHEIRTPMNAILGMSQLLAKTELAPDQASYLHAIAASAENLLVIINDILDLSKIEAGHMAVEHIGFSPAQVFEQIEKTLRFKAEEKGLSLITMLESQVPAVLLGDPYRLTQILLNLAGNSVKFTEQGSVSVACCLLETLPDGEVLVEFAVGDTGIGMEPEYLAHIFENFSQEDSSVSRRFGGTGLGLGISKKLVELLGGELRVSSQKGWGTTSRFVLRLPVGTPAACPPRPPRPTWAACAMPCAANACCSSRTIPSTACWPTCF